MRIDEQIEMLRKEVETAIRVFYALMSWEKLRSEQQYVDAVNKNVYFWKIFSYSVQTQLFISLGRLYDNSNDAFSFNACIKNCRENIKEFGKDAFEKRKLAGKCIRPEWLDDRLSDSYFADIRDIDALAKLAKPYKRIMNSLYKDIRNKVYAHAVHTDEDAISNLLKDTKIGEIENALMAFWSIYNQLWELYHNGRKPTLEINPYPYKDQIVNCVRLAVIGETAGTEPFISGK